MPRFFSSIFLTSRRKAKNLFKCWDRSLPYLTLKPVTTCFANTADDDLLTFCPPLPEAFMNLNSISFFLIPRSVIFFSRASIFSFLGPMTTYFLNICYNVQWKDGSKQKTLESNFIQTTFFIFFPASTGTRLIPSSLWNFSFKWNYISSVF